MRLRRLVRWARVPQVETDEPLETGYGTASPRGDDLCNDYQQGLAEAYMARWSKLATTGCLTIST